MTKLIVMLDLESRPGRAFLKLAQTDPNLTLIHTPGKTRRITLSPARPASTKVH